MSGGRGKHTRTGQWLIRRHNLRRRGDTGRNRISRNQAKLLETEMKQNQCRRGMMPISLMLWHLYHRMRYKIEFAAWVFFLSAQRQSNFASESECIYNLKPILGGLQCRSRSQDLIRMSTKSNHSVYKICSQFQPNLFRI